MSDWTPRRCVAGAIAGVQCSNETVYGSNYCQHHLEVNGMAAPIHNQLVMPDDGGTGERMMKWFSGTHLPEELKDIVYEYRALGRKICNTIPAGPERTVALRKLVESKDCAVRAIIEGREEPKHGS